MSAVRSIIGGLTALALAGLFWALPAAAGQDRNAQLSQLVEGKGDSCVEPTDVMRRAHYEFLLHQRDDTVIRGVRTKDHSLKNCVSCHANKDDNGDYIPVNEEGQFCAVCHQDAAVTIDCFSCHATRPRNDR